MIRDRQSVCTAVQTQLRTQGYFQLPHSKTTIEIDQQGHRQALREVISLYRKNPSTMTILCDVSIQTSYQSLIETCSLADVQSGKISIQNGIVFKFKKSDVQSIKILALCKNEVSFASVLKEIRVKTLKKNVKYGLSKEAKKEESQIIQISKEEYNCLPKRKEMSKIPQLQQKLQSKTNKNQRRLLLRDQSSESEQYYFPSKEKPTQLGNSSMSKLKHLISEGSNLTGTKGLQERKSSKDNRGQRSASLDLNNQLKKKESKQPQGNKKKKGSKNQINLADVKKQSDFMSKWIQRSQSN